MFDRIIISTDDSHFSQYWPIVSTAWQKFFPGIKISLGFVTNRPENDILVSKMREYGEVVLFPVIEGVPSANQGKMARHILAGQYKNEVCMIEDIDTIPMQSQFVVNLANSRKENTLLVVGCEVYKGSPHEGKFPISNIAAESFIFQEMVNPDNLSVQDLYKSWIDLKVYDHKEAVNVDPSVFSDESLLRVLISRWNPNRDRITETPRNVNQHADWIDRSWWGIDENKMYSGNYIICNFLRPFSDNYYNIEPVVKFIYNNQNIKKEEVIIE